MAPQGIANVARLAAEIDDLEARLPEAVRGLGRLLLEQVGSLDAKIGELDKEVRKRAKESDEAKRLMSIPGIGPVCAMAIQAFAPPMEGFRCGRDFSAWLSLVPRQCSTGEKPKLGRISKMGSATSGGCSLPGRSQSSDGRRGAEPKILGWPRC